ncbi:MAG: chromate transporter [Scytonema sp. PMC 1069.18]|nr:chromate transporter [Scytonema sp. PMC 1069.18]MEC4887649.1 chromate transporter [Scytonema sp. PMC 1070.18]
MSNASSEQVQRTTSPSLSVIVSFFTGIGASAFGGSIPTHVVPSCLRRGWLTERESLEALNWCRCLPGAGGTNLSAYLGYCWQKAEGALLATLALVLPGSIAILVASKLLSNLPQQIVQASLIAVAAASIGLLLELTLKLARSTLTDYIQLLVAIATFVLVGIFRVPIPLVLVVIVPFTWHLNSKNQT